MLSKPAARVCEHGTLRGIWLSTSPSGTAPGVSQSTERERQEVGVTKWTQIQKPHLKESLERMKQG